MKSLITIGVLLSLTLVSNATVIQSDDFSGTTLSSQWTSFLGGSYSTVTVANNAVTTTVTNTDPNYASTGIVSATGYTLPTGDFSIQVDALKGYSSGFWATSRLYINVGGTVYELIQAYESATQRYVYVNTRNTTVNIVSDAMQYRIDRVDDTLSFYAKSATAEDWTTISTVSGVSTTADTTVAMYVRKTTSNGYGIAWSNFTVTVPEPATMCLVGLGSAVMLGCRKRKV